MAAITEITSEADLSSHLSTLSSSALLVLYFYTPWTAFRTSMSAEMAALASQYPVTVPPSISFVGINAKALPTSAKEYGVSTAPCVVCLRSEQILESIKGSNIARIHGALDRHAGITANRIPTSLDVVSVPTELSAALVVRLSGLVKMAPVMLFMKGTRETPLCRFSRRMVKLLQDHSIEYGFFNILADEDVRNGLKQFGEWPTFPQLWVDGELIGGLEIVSGRHCTAAHG